jgi:hypothetical protein
MTTSEYGRRAASKYVEAHAQQGGVRYTTACRLTFAWNMLGKFISMTRLEGDTCPPLPKVPTDADWLAFAHALLAQDTAPAPVPSA